MEAKSAWPCHLVQCAHPWRGTQRAGNSGMASISECFGKKHNKIQMHNCNIRPWAFSIICLIRIFRFLQSTWYLHAHETIQSWVTLQCYSNNTPARYHQNTDSYSRLHVQEPRKASLLIGSYLTQQPITKRTVARMRAQTSKCMINVSIVSYCPQYAFFVTTAATYHSGSTTYTAWRLPR